MNAVTPDWLQSIEALKDVPPDQLQWLIDRSRFYSLAEGEYLIKTGDTIAGTHIIIEGRMRIFAVNTKSSRNIGYFESKEITGYLPFSRGLVSPVTIDAVIPTSLMSFPIEEMPELIRTHFELTQAMVHVMTSRVREFTTLQQQNEKMMALGKLSAGLAHELNNPSSAIVRSSSLLKKHLKSLPETFKEVISIRMSDQLIDTVNEKMLCIISHQGNQSLSLIERSSKEDELNDWMADNGVNDGFELAENFLEYGLTISDLEELRNLTNAEELPVVLNFINNNLITEKMVGDIKEAAQRISELVSSVKNFTHMDRGYDKIFSDVHTGIENTLSMLSYKIRKNNIRLVKDFDPSLPQLKALVGELNQVWTNLIDNAIDAMEGKGQGTLTISTSQEREFLKIIISDDGPGVPDDIKSRIFEPFFTTKDLGKGTGLGLDVVNRIIKQHNGSIKLKSVAGHTEFIVCLPVNG